MKLPLADSGSYELLCRFEWRAFMFHRFRASGCVFTTFMVLTLSTGSVVAQTISTGTDSAAAAISQTTATEAIGVGDLVQITVFGHPELSQDTRVGNDGKTQLALLGDIALSGMTEADATTLISNQLRERNVLLHPRVMVVIKESASQNISVIGEVHHPGVYPVTGSRTLLDVLSLAGGLTDVADPNIHIKRRSGVENKVAAKLNGSDAGALSSAETTVYPGDSIVVPRAGIVYVLGDVARPGGFVMRDSGKITLLQVMAEAGGTLPTASPSHLVLLRKEKENSTATKKLDLGKIARGREADVELQANDIIFVPNAKLKSALRASGTLASTASAISTVAIYGLM
jgi:polysaccharide biosynthesis/export protein